MKRYRAERLGNGFVRCDDRRSGLVTLWEVRDGKVQRRSGQGLATNDMLSAVREAFAR